MQLTAEQRLMVDTFALGGVDGYEGPHTTTADGGYLYPKAADMTAICRALLEAQRIVDGYATAARVIGLHLAPFMVDDMPYDQAIADAARKARRLLDSIRMKAAMGRSFGHQATPQTPERMVERKDEALSAVLQMMALSGIAGSCLRDSGVEV